MRTKYLHYLCTFKWKYDGLYCRHIYRHWFLTVPHRLAFDGLIRGLEEIIYAGNNCAEVAVRGAERDESSHHGGINNVESDMKQNNVGLCTLYR